MTKNWHTTFSTNPQAEPLADRPWSWRMSYADTLLLHYAKATLQSFGELADSCTVS
jgi:hypothetical protein